VPTNDNTWTSSEPLGAHDWGGSTSPEPQRLVPPTIRPQLRQHRVWLPQALLALFRVFVLKVPTPVGNLETQTEAAVVAINDHADERRLFVTATDEEAIEKAERVRREYDELGPEAWCERYKVPLDWLTPGESWWDGPD